MSQTTANPTTTTRTPRLTLPHLLLALALVLFAYRSYDYFVPTFFGLADEHGYLTTAKRLATTGHFVLHQNDPCAFIGETMMKATTADDYYLRQPIGYPILCAAAYFLGGQEAPFLVNPLLGLAALAGIFILGKQLKAPLAGALAALVLAAHPVFLYYSIKPLSHIPDLAIGVWTLVAALAWQRDRKPVQALLVGTLLGAALMIRYTNILLALPLMVILLDSLRQIRWPRLLAHAALATVPTAAAGVALMAYHSIAFGHPLKTGYSAGGNDVSFSLAYLRDHAPAMLQCLAQPATGLSLLLAAALVGIVILSLRNRFLVLLLLAWALPPLIINTAYYGKPRDNMLLYTRFALASYPALLLLALSWTSFLPDPKKILRITLGLITAGAITWSCFDPPMNGPVPTLELTRNRCRFVLAAADLLKQKAPAGSIILADNYTDYYVDYMDPGYRVYSPDMYDPAQIRTRLADLDQLPHEFDPGRTRDIKTYLGNRSEQDLSAILKQHFNQYLEIGRPVFILASDNPQLGNRFAIWKSRLAMPLTRVAYNKDLGLGLYQLSPTR